jgi:putative component of toxin-antitoxin plasmid stabilization module
MSTFDVQSLESVVGTIKFFKLVVDGESLFDAFEEEIKKDGNLEKQLVVIESRLDDIANLRLLPFNKFKDITPAKEKVKEYEIKTHDLRVYLIKDEEGNLIILGGKKNTQQSDIKRFKSLKKQYLKYRDEQKIRNIKKT